MALKSSLSAGQTVRKLTLAGGTFAVAMGIGFFMQQREADAAYTQSQILPMPMPITTPAEPAMPEVAAAAVALSEIPDATPKQITLPQAVPVLAELDAELVVDCTIEMATVATDAALVRVSLDAPCAPSTAFTLHHEGMMFTAQTDAGGNATLIAPALAEEAVFIAAFEDGEGAIGTVSVPSLVEYDRTVVQWRGEGGFELHALEFGATYGEPGHVWLETPSTASVAASGAGGFLMALGDGRVESPRFAQVYTFPATKTPQSGKVLLTLEAEVTEANCATDVEAQTLERHAAEGSVKILDLTLSVPACEAVGDFLVLRNILSDLTVQNS